MSTATRTAARNCLPTSTGRLSTTRPSTRRPPSQTTGGSATGIDMLARTARARSPWLRITCAPSSRAVATQRKGMGSWLKSVPAAYPAGASCSIRKRLMRCSARRPGPSSSFDQLKSTPASVRKRSWRRATGTMRRSGRPLNIDAPVDGQDDLVELLRGAAAGVDRADDRPHAVGGDGVDRDPRLLEGLQGADVGDSPGAAPAQDQGEAGWTARELDGPGSRPRGRGTRARAEGGPRRAGNLERMNGSLTPRTVIPKGGDRGRARDLLVGQATADPSSTLRDGLLGMTVPGW